MNFQSLCKGALASVLFMLLAVSVSENAAAQTVEFCPADTSATQARNRDPHAAEVIIGTCLVSGLNHYTYTEATNNCGICQSACASTGGVSLVAYAYNGNNYCGPQSQCNAVGGTLSVGGTVCGCDVNNVRGTDGVCRLNHQACYDANFREPIANSSTAGDCRAAANNPEDIAACATINPEGFAVGHFTEVVQGACSGHANQCITLDEYMVLPEVARRGGDVGRCYTAGEVCYDSGRVGVELAVRAHPEERSGEQNVCRFAASDAECATISGGEEPEHDPNENDRCRQRAAEDCAHNEEFTASTDPADGGGSCTQCEGHEFSMNGGTCEECAVNTFRGTGASCEACQIANEVRALEETACSCKDPHITDSGECRLPTGDAECATVGDGSAPIFDEDEPTNCRALDGTDCPTGQVLLTGAGACSACTGLLTPNTERTACECADPHVEVGGECRLPTGNTECATVGDGSMPIFDENEPTNCRALDGTDCPTGQVLLTGAAACSACTGLLTPNTDRDACECADPNVEVNGECQVAVSSCTGVQERVVDNVCTECDRDQHLVNGACVACDPNEVRAQEAAECTCPVFTDTDGSCIPFTVCADPLEVNEADNTCFCNSATHFEETDGSCVAHAVCDTESNEVRNSENNTCVCADNSEGTPETACTACTGGKTSQGGADCACPADMPFDREGVCEASLDGTCTEPRDFYNPVTNMCECPTGQRLNADETACEAIPASSDGGSSNGAVIALVAVPVVLIGGYWLLGGFEYIDPAYGLNYSGENDSLSYSAFGGFDLNHGDLSSYVRAIQSNGDAVAYESGISYGKDIYSLNYAAYESQSEYAYDLSANLNYGSGLWSISPTADAEFHYSADSEDWTSEAGAGLTAAWTSHKWNVRAHSAFAGDLNHGLDVEFRF